MPKVTFKQLSVVIPVGPNDQSWRKLIDELAVFGTELDIVLAACFKQPDDIELAQNVSWVQSAKGRATQLNAGAKYTPRNFIWFLHADTQLTSKVMPSVQDYIKSAENTLGYFKLRFANDGPQQTQLNALAANIRSRLFGLPFGDQGFILSKRLFTQLNGFDETVILGEDLDFVVRIKAANVTLQELPAELITSARRYQQQGWLMTSIRHIYLTWQLTRQAKQRLGLVL